MLKIDEPITRKALDRSPIWRKFRWNGGSEHGGYDEYWFPLTAVGDPDPGGFKDRRLGITINEYGHEQVRVSLWSSPSLGQQQCIALPRVTMMRDLITLAKLCRLPCSPS